MLKYFAGVGKVWGSALAHRVQKGGIPGKKKSIHDLPTGIQVRRLPTGIF
jgi:hypothetical protein